jgi:drug/metabolite transporter (DMT)-like permease
MISRNSHGLISIIWASFFFGLMAFMVKVLSKTLPAAEILFVRSFVGMLLVMALIFYIYRSFKTVNRNMLFVRGLFGGMSVFLYFTAISRIPLSSATMLANSYPLFAAMFAVILLKERPHFDTALALLISFVGMYLILNPRFGALDLGYILALGSAVFGGVAVASIRQLRKTDSSLAIVFAFLAGGALFSLPFMARGFRTPGIFEWELLLAIAIVGTIAQIVFTRPFKIVTVYEGSVVALSNSVFTLLFSVLFLNEVLGPRFIAGALLIFGGSLYLIAKEEKWFARISKGAV